MQLISGCSFNEARPPPTRSFTAVLPGTALSRLTGSALRSRKMFIKEAESFLYSANQYNSNHRKQLSFPKMSWKGPVIGLKSNTYCRL